MTAYYIQIQTSLLEHHGLLTLNLSYLFRNRGWYTLYHYLIIAVTRMYDLPGPHISLPGGGRFIVQSSYIMVGTQTFTHHILNTNICVQTTYSNWTTLNSHLKIGKVTCKVVRCYSSSISKRCVDYSERYIYSLFAKVGISAFICQTPYNQNKNKNP